MNKREVEIIKILCECNMNVLETSRRMYMHHNSIAYHIDKIKRKYGLDPRCFRDLVRLDEMANEAIENPEKEIAPLCIWCGLEIKTKRRAKFCSEKCRKDFWSYKTGDRKKMCMECEHSLKDAGSKRWKCKKTGKIVIDINGKSNKNSSACMSSRR